MTSNENERVGGVGDNICIKKRWISLQLTMEYNGQGSHALSGVRSVLHPVTPLPLFLQIPCLPS